MKLHKHWKGIALFLLPAVALYAAYFLYPLGYVFIIGLTQWNGVTAPEFRGLANYLDLLPGFVRAAQLPPAPGAGGDPDETLRAKIKHPDSRFALRMRRERRIYQPL